jgi:hypothetical protein
VSQLATHEVTYLPSAELKALESPSKDLAAALEALDSGEWKVEFAALDEIRRACIWHADLCLPQLGVIVRKVNGQVDNNLRSSVRKNAVLCLQAIFCTLGKHVENHMHLLVPTLCKRAVEDNHFLAGEADVALQALIVNVTPSKATKAMLNAATAKDKADQIRAVAVKCLGFCVESFGVDLLRHRILGDLLSCLSELLYDRGTFARAHAKTAVAELVRLLQEDQAAPQEHEERVRWLKAAVDKHVPAKHQDRFLGAMQKAGVRIDADGAYSIEQAPDEIASGESDEEKDAADI